MKPIFARFRDGFLVPHMHDLSPRHFFLEQGICPLFVLFDSPPTGLEMRLDNDATHLADAQSRRKETAQKEKGVFRGHPEPRQRAVPSALPKTVGERDKHDRS